MQIIYEPTGKAKEYADLAINIYNGCTHGCVYCYAKRYKKEEYYTAADPKKDFIAKLKQDIEQLRSTPRKDIPEILLSFQGDVYQPVEMELNLTRQALILLREANLSFTVLTKGGSRVIRDFDILQDYPARFGTSLIWGTEEEVEQFEPGAASVWDRIKTIIEAKERGIPTWVSLEPVIDPLRAYECVRDLHDYVDFWKVGKINHHKEFEKDVDWIEFRENITEMLDGYHCQYYIKKSLSEL